MQERSVVEGVAGAEPCVPEERAGRRSPRVLGRVAALFGAMGDPNRLKLLATLMEAESCTGDLAAALGVTESAVSHQLRLLKGLDLVRSRRAGKFVYHALADAHVRALIETACAHAAEEEARAPAADARADRSRRGVPA